MSTATFAGKELIVAGGTHGIGPAIVMAAVRQGAKVVFCGRPGSETSAADLVATARAEGLAEQLFFLPVDTSNETGIDELFSVAFEQFNTLHVLIHNAAEITVPLNKPLIETSLADWNETLEVYLREPFLLSRRAIEEFLSSGEGGRIINVIAARISSTQGRRVGYAAAQSALSSFTRSVTKEYGPRGIFCNAVLVPGNLEDSSAGTLETVLFLASDEASYINGQVLYLGVGASHNRPA